jgi:hypothetical protein
MTNVVIVIIKTDTPAKLNPENSFPNKKEQFFSALT